MGFELAITNATVIDGTGRPRFRADLGIQRGTIAAIAALGSAAPCAPTVPSASTPQVTRKSTTSTVRAV